MKGLDTNILIRFLVGDDRAQAEKVYDIFKKIEAEKKELFVPLPVVLELIWVLESVYGISRSEILASISDLLLMPILKFECPVLVRLFLQAAKGNRHDLADLLIGCCARQQGCESVLTFDGKASTSQLFELVG